MPWECVHLGQYSRPRPAWKEVQEPNGRGTFLPGWMRGHRAQSIRARSGARMGPAGGTGARPDSPCRSSLIPLASDSVRGKDRSNPAWVSVQPLESHVLAVRYPTATPNSAYRSSAEEPGANQACDAGSSRQGDAPVPPRTRPTSRSCPSWNERPA